jgi:SAM-dependent methyltransferase
MNTGDYSELFGQYYYAHNCGAPYERTDAWLAFFDKVAERIIADFQPGSVLDAGCAKGFLVERLRARGVQAWGIDISEFAIKGVHPDIKDYCFVGSITEPLPQTYDLIVSIEVVEHMNPEDSTRAIENMCRSCDNILLSSSPYDYKEATHINVQMPDYWARQFARHGFYHDLDYDATYITKWALRFYRMPGSVQPVIQSYERRMWQLQSELKELRGSVIDYHKKLQASEQRRIYLENQPLLSQLQECQQYIVDIKNTRSWQLVQKMQSMYVRFAPPGSGRQKMIKRLLRR